MILEYKRNARKISQNNNRQKIGLQNSPDSYSDIIIINIIMIIFFFFQSQNRLLARPQLLQVTAVKIVAQRIKIQLKGIYI